jgi:hypothetical protein
LSEFLPDQTPEEARQDSAKFKAILILCATTAFVVSPFLLDPFTGFNPDQLPNPIAQPPIQPAGYAFSIWGVIYLWILAMALFGLVKRDTAADWDRGRWPLLVSLAVGASWIAVALSAPVMATVLIWVMLIGAIWALWRVPQRDRAWLALPLGLYAGWLTAASCVALATILIGYNILSPMAASWAALALALAIAIPLARRFATLTYPLAIAWALIGVAVQNASFYPALALAAAAGATGMAWLMLRYRRPDF